MCTNAFIQETENFVKQQLSEADGSHDWLHICRARQNAIGIARALNDSLSQSQVSQWPLWLVLEKKKKEKENINENKSETETETEIENKNLNVEKAISDRRPDVPNSCNKKKLKWLKRKLDVEIIEMAILLHDIGDFKYSKSETLGNELIYQHLKKIGYPSEKLQMILNIIENVSYRKELANPNFFMDLLIKEEEEMEKIIEKNKNDSKEILLENKNDQSHVVEMEHEIYFPSLWGYELAIVQDADRLDAIGAIGIARCFTYGAVSGHPLYDPDNGPSMQMTGAEYNQQTVQNKGNPIHHFYEKLIHIKDKMKTLIAHQIALERHEFMIHFIRTFEKEVGLKNYLMSS